MQLEVLGKIHHQHLLLLLGACLDRPCLVYEYMENGNLENRLQCKGGTAPLPWHHRFRIAFEVALALVFLHRSKPKPVIHRDLKPANILLGRNFTSKIGDAGLATLLPSRDVSSTRTIYKDTDLVGTMFYMDPEYQRQDKFHQSLTHMPWAWCSCSCWLQSQQRGSQTLWSEQWKRIALSTYLTSVQEFGLCNKHMT
jgi:serine/threonine protein kinase